MVKAQVTEEDLAQGIQSLGGFGNLAQKPRRDSPFGPDFAQKRPQPKPAPATSVAAPMPPIANPLPTPVRVAPVAEAPRSTQPVTKQVEVIVPLNNEVPQVHRASNTKITSQKKEKPRLSEQAVEAHPVSETYTERITLQMTPEMRDTLNDIARVLQRARRDKGSRLTANTVMRVALQRFIDTHDPKALGGVSSEEELLQVVKGHEKAPR